MNTSPSILLNGQPYALADMPSVAELLQRLGFAGKRIAVECNGEIVPRSRHGDTPVRPGDRLEIVVAVGGG